MPLPQALYRASEVPLHFPPFLFLDRSLILISLFLLTLFFNLILLTLFPSYNINILLLGVRNFVTASLFVLLRRLPAPLAPGYISLFLLIVVFLFKRREEKRI